MITESTKQPNSYYKAAIIILSISGNLVEKAWINWREINFWVLEFIINLKLYSTDSSQGAILWHSVNASTNKSLGLRENYHTRQNFNVKLFQYAYTWFRTPSYQLARPEEMTLVRILIHSWGTALRRALKFHITCQIFPHHSVASRDFKHHQLQRLNCIFSHSCELMTYSHPLDSHKDYWEFISR